MKALRAITFLVAFTIPSCTSSTPPYPPRPPATPGSPVADPQPSRVVVHATVASVALRGALDRALPTAGEGDVTVLGKARHYAWSRAPLDIRFVQGRIGVRTRVDVRVDLPVSHLDLPIDLGIVAEPVVSASYVARLQSLEVEVTSNDTKLKLAEAAVGALDKIRDELRARLADFSYDLRPALDEAYARLTTPIDLPLGDAHGCAALRVVGVEAGPTVLADGIEKDLALVVEPSVTLPCAVSGPPPPVPPLANVSSIATGPFTVEVPIAAEYDELARALAGTWKDGRLYFSTEYPELFLEKPEVYASHDEVVLKLHLQGPIHRFGGDHFLDGDLFLAGHPVVEDNEIRVPDLEPTIETQSFLLKLKAMVDGDKIRDQARAALRVDVAERVQAVRAKLSTELAFGDGDGCLRAEVSKVEVRSIHAHGAYLRIHVAATAHASAYLPCPSPGGG